MPAAREPLQLYQLISDLVI